MCFLPHWMFVSTYVYHLSTLQVYANRVKWKPFPRVSVCKLLHVWLVKANPTWFVQSALHGKERCCCFPSPRHCPAKCYPTILSDQSRPAPAAANKNTFNTENDPICCKNIHTKKWHVWRALCASHQHTYTSTFSFRDKYETKHKQKATTTKTSKSHTNATNKPVAISSAQYSDTKSSCFYVSTDMRSGLFTRHISPDQTAPIHNNLIRYLIRIGIGARLWAKHTPTNKQTNRSKNSNFNTFIGLT